MDSKTLKSKKKNCETCIHATYDADHDEYRCVFLCRTILGKEVSRRDNCLFHEEREDATR